MAVLEAQDEMLQKTNGYIDIDRLRKVSYKSTKVARHFARMMGKADSYAVAHMNDDDVENMDTIAQSQAKKLSNDETGATITTVATSDSITIDNDCYSIGDNDSLLMIPRVDEIDDLVSTSSNTHNFNDSMSSIASPTTPTRSLFHSTTKSKSKTPSAFRRFRFSSRRKLKEEDASSSSPPQQPDAEVL